MQLHVGPTWWYLEIEEKNLDSTKESRTSLKDTEETTQHFLISLEADFFMQLHVGLTWWSLKIEEEKLSLHQEVKNILLASLKDTVETTQHFLISLEANFFMQPRLSLIIWTIKLKKSNSTKRKNNIQFL